MAACQISRAFSKHIAYENRWGNEESRSGAGSTLSYTYNLRHELENVVAKFEDRYFSRRALWRLQLDESGLLSPKMKYIGGDIVPYLIRENNLEL